MPGLAARTMAWQRRMSGTAGPLSASGEAGNGEPVQIELLIDGVWTDITTYVMVRDNSGNIGISRGRRDEGSQTEQSTCQLTLDNRDGRFSPRNPVGVYYGMIGRNQPVRVSVPDGIGGKSYRFWGEISSWPQAWDPTGTDVWTEVEASGILRRLSQGPPPARSVLYSALTDPISEALVAYWPCEDASDSSTVASALTNGSVMFPSGTPTFASYDGFPASDPVIDLSAASITGGVTRYDDPTATQVRFLVSIPSDGLTDGKVICAIDQLDYLAGATQFWELYYTTTGNTLILRQCATDGTNLGITLDHTLDVRGKKLYVSVELQESGANITRALRLVNLTSMDADSVTDTSNLTQLTRVTSIAMGPTSRSVVSPIGTRGLPDTAVGHITVENSITAIDILGLRLNPIGEAAGDRIQRICSEEGIAFGNIGNLDDSVLMGNQGKLNPLGLMQECELADGGLLYENLSVLGLGYRTRAALYNQDAQLTLDYEGFTLSEVPTPVEDDRYIQNQVTVTVGDVSETYAMTDGNLTIDQPPSGVGVYGEDISLNLESSSDAMDQAAWRVHLGTVDEARYPQISVNLAHPSFTGNPALKQAVLGLRQGDRILVQNPPAWIPPDDISQLILGFDETISHFEHKLTFNCAPASPYQIGVLDADLTRIDTDGSELYAAISSSDTSLTVVPSLGQTGIWTTDNAEAPWDIRVGGEVMHVTDVADFLDDTFTRTVSNGWGSADTGQAWSTGGGTAVDYAVGSGVGTHTLPTVDLSRRCFVDATSPDFDYYMSLTTSAAATGGSLYGGATGRYTDSDNLLMARLEFTTANALIIGIRRRLAGTETSLASYTLVDTYVPGTYYRIRFQAHGVTLRAKAWLATDIETPEWQATAIESAISLSGLLGVRSIASPSNTNVSPVVSYDNLQIVSPQVFTVTRSYNGVVKAHSAGADLRLANPWIIAL